MVYLSSEAYGEKWYKLGNHLFYTPDQTIITASSNFNVFFHQINSGCQISRTNFICSLKLKHRGLFINYVVRFRGGGGGGGLTKYYGLLQGGGGRLQIYYVVYRKKILWEKIVKSGAVAGGNEGGAYRQA